MEILHIMPAWFLNLNLIFELLFFIFAAAIAIYSFRIYALTKQRESKIFGFAFSFLGLSHLALAIVNNLFLSIISGGLRELDFDDIINLRNILVVAYVMFFIIGLISLVYISFKAKSIRTYLILLALSLVSIWFACNKSFVIYLLASIFLLLISGYYLSEYRRNHNVNTLFVFLGFSALAISSIFLAFVADYLLPQAYVSAYFIELIGYSLIISSLIKILKDGKKTK